MLRKLAVLAVLAAPALPAWSAADGFVDAFYVPSAQVKSDLGSASGDGFGAHAAFPIGEVFFVNGEYQRNDYNNAHGHLNEYRVGGGLESTPDKARAAVYGEYVRYDDRSGGDKPDGFGLHARFTFDVIPPLKLFGEAGYVRMSDHDVTFDGPEFLIGGTFSFTKTIGAFADYRISHLDGNGGGSADAKLRSYDARVGVRFNFFPI